MGSVKTNRLRKALLWSNGTEPCYGTVVMYDRLYERSERTWRYFSDESNNRRKLAGLPLIRRAKS